MSRFRNVVRTLAALVVGGALFSAPRQAQATFSIHLQSGADSATIVDNGAGDLTNTTDGLITVQNLSFGDFTLSFSTANSNNGTLGADPTITINNLAITSKAAASLKITVTDNSFTSTAPGPGTNVISQLSDTALSAGSITYQSVVAFQSGPTLSVALAPDSDAANYTVNLPSGGFVVQSITNINLTKAGTVQMTGLTEVNTPQGAPLPSPAPAGLVLALSGAPFLGLAWVRRRLRAA